jgi:ParB-like chromosome segregation protein Spo0J
LTANKYNPNHVAPLELALLKKSILMCGWTQPIVVRSDYEIVDGFHRWTVAQDPMVALLTEGEVPIVFMSIETDMAKQMAATITHNRARGTHGVMLMADMVRSLKDKFGKDDAWMMDHLGMEEEEVIRLYDSAGSPDVVGVQEFSRGWVPEGLKA